jgi:hypothetical protein
MMEFNIRAVDGVYIYNSTNALQPVSIFRNENGKWDVVFTSIGKDVFSHQFKNFLEARRHAEKEIGLKE